MADISKIKTPDGTSYDIKDSTARTNKVDKSGDTMTGTLITPEVESVQYSFTNSGTEKAYIIYNATTNALDFVFV